MVYQFCSFYPKLLHISICLTPPLFAEHSVPSTSASTSIAPPAPAPAPVPPPLESRQKRTSSKSSSMSGGRRNRKQKHAHSVSAKDLGRWKPTDDLALIIGVQQV